MRPPSFKSHIWCLCKTLFFVQVCYKTYDENSKKGPAVHIHGNKQWILPNWKTYFNLLAAIFTENQPSGLQSLVCDLQSMKRFFLIFCHISVVNILYHLSVNRQARNWTLSLTVCGKINSFQTYADVNLEILFAIILKKYLKIEINTLQ